MNLMILLNIATDGGISTFHIVSALVIFIATIAAITADKLPNSISAVLGAFLFMVFHILSHDEAVHFIDFDTIGLLTGMMITVAVIRKSGLFEYIAIKGIKLTKGNPWKILVVLSIVTAVLSAFLDNVTTVLIIVPLTFAVSDAMNFNPIPILISEVIFSNIGGAATLIGDPPNIMIGGATDLNFMDFLDNNLPIVVVVSIVGFLMLRLYYHKKLSSLTVSKEVVDSFDESKTIQDRGYLIRSLFVFFLIILAFVTHHMHEISLASVALGGGFLMMTVTKQDPEEILKEVEWPTIFFFIGLFILVGGLEKVGIIKVIADKMMVITDGEPHAATQLVFWVSALSTTLVNSIPFTATMISVIKTMSETIQGSTEPLWWALSLGACFGGNGTLIGAAANIIVAGMTQKTDYPLKFMQYVKVAIPVMLMTSVFSSLYLYLRYFL